MSIYYVSIGIFVTVMPLNEHVNATHDGVHVLSYDSGGRHKKKKKREGGAAHSPRMSAAFTLNPDLPLCPLLLHILHEDRAQDFYLTAFPFFFFFFFLKRCSEI